MKRVVFWVVFLVAAGGALAYIWREKDPLRNHPYLLPVWVRHNVRLLAHPHPAVAHEAWLELSNLYFTKWMAFQMFPKEVANPAPISFLIERQSFPGGGEGSPAVEGFIAGKKPIYYKADRIYCRTVGEAMMAIMYREKRWNVEYQGNWQAWWEANGQYHR